MMRSRLTSQLTIGAGVAVTLLVVFILWLYRWQPTPGALFLVVGGMSLLAVAYFLARAASVDFSQNFADDESPNDARRAELEVEKRSLLKAIKEVEFDRDMLKIESSEADEAIRRYRARAIQIMQALDESKDYRVEVEKELARRLGQAESPATAGSCPGCGLVNDDDAAFCKACGKKLSA